MNGSLSQGNTRYHLNLVTKLRLFFAHHFGEVTYTGVCLLLGFYLVTSWTGLDYLGEHDITSWPTFPYWLLVTASTVGYGDLSPATESGRLFTAFFIIPFGLGLFTLVLGRIAAAITGQWKRTLQGKQPLKIQDHIIVLGWRGERTQHMLDLLLGEVQEAKKQRIVLYADKISENPYPNKIDFVSRLHDHQLLAQDHAQVARASLVIIDECADDKNFSLALQCAKLNPKARIIVHFRSDVFSNLLHSHCPHAECLPSISVEILAKSAMDPGTSELHHQLLSVHHGMTQFSAEFPAGRPRITYEELLVRIKQSENALVIGFEHAGKLLLNPKKLAEIVPGDRIFYIAAKRLDNSAWYC